MSNILRTLKRGMAYAHTKQYHPSRASEKRNAFMKMAEKKAKREAIVAKPEVKRKVLEK